MMRRGAALGKKCQTVAVVAYRATFDDLISKPKKKLKFFVFVAPQSVGRHFLAPLRATHLLFHYHNHKQGRGGKDINHALNKEVLLFPLGHINGSNILPKSQMMKQPPHSSMCPLNLSV